MDNVGDVTAGHGDEAGNQPNVCSDVLPARKPWLFQSGNRHGRGRASGSKNRLSRDFNEAVFASWQVHGVAALEQLARDNPAAFLLICAKVAVKQMEIAARTQTREPSALGAMSEDDLLGHLNLLQWYQERVEAEEAGRSPPILARLMAEAA